MIFKQKNTKINKMVNYENGMIYKLCCKDPTVKDIYIGSTTNFRLRKNCHKSRCNNEKNNKYYNLNVYKFIRDNGNWKNWNMVLVDEVKCKSKLELHKKEREWFDKLNATLNCDKPNRTKKEWTENNKEKIKKQKKEWREKNNEKIKIKSKEWREKNNEKIKAYNKEWRKNNKEKIICECGTILLKNNLNRHKKISEKHLQYVKR
jgi:hypothetical protein